MDFSRIDRRPVTITVTATNADSTSATIDTLEVALLPAGRSPTADTAWTATDFADGKAEVLIAGPDAEAADAIVITPPGGRLWIKDPAADATQAVPAGRIRLL